MSWFNEDGIITFESAERHMKEQAEKEHLRSTLEHNRDLFRVAFMEMEWTDDLIPESTDIIIIDF